MRPGGGGGGRSSGAKTAKTAVNTSVYGNQTERELGMGTGLACFLVLEYIL